MAITVVSKFKIRSGQEEPILGYMRGYAEWLRSNEPKTLRWDIYQAEEQGAYICIEEFSDQAAIEKHAASAAVYFGDKLRHLSVDSEIIQQDHARQLISA